MTDSAVAVPIWKPSRTTVTTFGPISNKSNNATTDDYEEGVWVTSVCSAASWIGCALSNDSVQVHDVERLQQTQRYQNCGGTVTDLVTDSAQALACCSKSGRVCIFDVRQSNVALSFQLASKNEEALSMDLGYGGILAAVGSSANFIHFFDLRNGANKLLGSYVDAHTEEVTKVRFQPVGNTASGSSSLLASASEDGLSCIFDTSKPSEEAALQGVLNAQAPLREVGFFGPEYEGVYCLTGSETLSVWHHDSAQRICDWPNLRQQLSQQAKVPIDYLVNCYWDSSNQQLSLLAGNVGGDGALFQVDAGSISSMCLLQSGHKGVIRSCTQLTGEAFATAGEDARLCEWNGTTGGTTVPAQSGGSRPKARRQKSKSTSNPY